MALLVIFVLISPMFNFYNTVAASKAYTVCLYRHYVHCITLSNIRGTMSNIFIESKFVCIYNMLHNFNGFLDIFDYTKHNMF